MILGYRSMFLGSGKKSNDVMEKVSYWYGFFDG